MIYTLARDTDGDGLWSDELSVEYDVGTLPRVGDTVSCEGKMYAVRQVLHVVAIRMQGTPNVRVVAFEAELAERQRETEYWEACAVEEHERGVKS